MHVGLKRLATSYQKKDDQEKVVTWALLWSP